jgi:hypothetical protein
MLCLMMCRTLEFLYCTFVSVLARCEDLHCLSVFLLILTVTPTWLTPYPCCFRSVGRVCVFVLLLFIPAAINLEICEIEPISAFYGWSLFCKQTNKHRRKMLEYLDDLVNRMSAERP